MKIDARIKLTSKEGPTLGYGQIVFDNSFVVDGIKVMHGKNGPFVSFPSRKTQEGEYKDICFPITKELRQQIIDTVLAKYQAELPF